MFQLRAELSFTCNANCMSVFRTSITHFKYNINRRFSCYCCWGQPEASVRMQDREIYGRSDFSYHHAVTHLQHRKARWTRSPRFTSPIPPRRGRVHPSLRFFPFVRQQPQPSRTKPRPYRNNIYRYFDGDHVQRKRAHRSVPAAHAQSERAATCASSNAAAFFNLAILSERYSRSMASDIRHKNTCSKLHYIPSEQRALTINININSSSSFICFFRNRVE